MKLGVKNNDFSTNSELHGNFRVANNAAMQKILSDSLYQDKIKSVIREITCNALDAHKENGVTKKIYVQLPTSLEPVFAVRDYGKGLSLEELEDLYTVYGVSTKRQSNDSIGAFGLGSKSPFSYTKMWTVISRHDGMKYVVCNSVNSKGAFCYDVLHKEECDEPSGLEVRFDVDRGDIYNFETKARETFQFFDETPDTNINMKVEKPKYTHMGDKYGVVSYNKDYYAKNLVRVGPVAYPIELEHFKGNAKTILDCCNIHLIVDIGDVEINPGRESLGYGKHTIDTLTAILEKVYDEVKEKAEKEASTCKNLWEARIFATKYLNSGNYIGKILNYKIDFNGKTVTNTGYVNPYITLPNGIRESIDVFEYKYDKWEKRVKEFKTGVHIDIEENVRFAIYETGGYAASRRFVEQNPTIKLYVFKDTHKGWITDELGYPEADILMTSKFPAAVRQARAKSTGNKVQAYRFDHNNKYSHWNNSAKNYWEAEQIDLDAETGYYAPIKEFLINDIVSCSQIEGEFAGLNVIGVLISRKEKVENHKNWTHIKEFFKKKVDKLIADPDILKYSGVSSYSEQLNRLIPVYNSLKRKDTALAKAIKEVDLYLKSKKKVEEFQRYKRIYEQISGETYNVSPPKKISLDFKLDDYPMMKYVSLSYYNTSEVVDYINQIDKEL